MKEMTDAQLVRLNHLIIDCNSQGLIIAFPEGLSEGSKSLVKYSCGKGHHGHDSLSGLDEYMGECPMCYHEAQDWLIGGA